MGKMMTKILDILKLMSIKEPGGGSLLNVGLGKSGMSFLKV